MSHREAAIVLAVPVRHSTMDHARVSDRTVSPSTTYLAHVRRNDDGSFAIHDLEEHVRAVASQLRRAAEPDST
jgi:hypothetical protein